uniref:(+)-delta-cadinene synthase n=1 Tax=Opuntia streptacantha TaxID=393608 RepID=A0A7C9DYN4_OPUST
MEHSVVSAAPRKNQQPLQVVRPLITYRHPDLWGDFFLNYTPPQAQDTQLQMEQELADLEREARKKLLDTNNNPKERIVFIDAVERLGVAYHFAEEIETILQQFYDKYMEHSEFYQNDLHTVSLIFRILRQHGFWVSSDVFEKFKGDDGCFKESIIKDVQGMLSLYEATFLGVKGEKILDEALEFATTQLESLVGILSEPQATEVTRALKKPLHVDIPRLVSRYYIDIYEGNPCHDKTLLRFAKIDFNLLQLMHLKELQHLSRWWKCLDLPKRLPFARDRIVESYFWASGTFCEPQYALGRVICAQIVQILTIHDDTYDTYGLFEELESYTKALHRWDKTCMDQLPDYMKLIYEALIDTFEGFVQDLAKEGRSHLVFYARELFKAQCRSYYQEAKWLHDKYVPTYEEHMVAVGITTAGTALLSATALLGIREIAGEEPFKWISQTPKLVKASCVIGRLLNDIVGCKNKNQIPSAVECFMAQYDASEEKAIEELYKKVEEAWKELNEEMLKSRNLPRQLLTVILNLTRLAAVIYRFDVDEFTVSNQAMRSKIQALFIDPIPL